jgi:hypothetical protein
MRVQDAASSRLFRFLLIAVAGWMNQKQQFAIDYLRDENRVLSQTSVSRKALTRKETQ